MKKIISTLLIIVLIISSINISVINVEAATKLKEYNITLNVGVKKHLDTSIINNFDFYAPGGKYTINDASIIGIECEYNKKRDEWQSYMVGLRPGKTTIIEWHNNNKYIKYNITVKRVELDSITSFFGLVKEDIGHYGPEETDKTAQDILKKLNLEQYNSDRERIGAVAKYLYETISFTSDWRNNKELHSAYGALVMKKAFKGILNAAVLLLKNLGFDIIIPSDYQYFCLMKLEGTYYVYNSLDLQTYDFMIGSKGYNLVYAGEGTYTNEAGEILQGSLYYDESGEIDDWLADSYINDVYNGILTTHGTNEKNCEEDFCYLSTERKSHLPAWLIGIETPQQIILKGKSKELPNDRLSSTVFSSDESVVKVENNKIVGVKEGIAIVYRYDDTYCDAFYVVVDKKTSSKKVQVNFKADGKKHTTYKATDIYVNRKILNEVDFGLKRLELWEKTILYNLEPALNGGKLQTTYKNGCLKAIVIDSDGKRQTVFDDTDYIDEY